MNRRGMKRIVEMERKKLAKNGNGGGNKLKGNVDRVCVASKLPNGLILRVYEMVDRSEQTLQGPKSVKVAQIMPDPDDPSKPWQFTLAGTALFRGTDLSGRVNPVLFGGYALTPGIPKEFWELWLSQHSDMDIVKSQMIFAHKSSQDAEAHAKENRKERSGLEPLVPPVTNKFTGERVGELDPRLRRLTGNPSVTIGSGKD
jgi:hypothetical protein